MGFSIKKEWNRAKREAKRVGNQIGTAFGVGPDQPSPSPPSPSGPSTQSPVGGSPISGGDTTNVGQQLFGDGFTMNITPPRPLDADIFGGDMDLRLPNRDEVISKVLYDQLIAINKKRSQLGGLGTGDASPPTASTTLFGI